MADEAGATPEGTVTDRGWTVTTGHGRVAVYPTENGDDC